MTKQTTTPRFVNADTVLAALEQIEETASDRKQHQAVRLSIVRRRIVTLSQQIENQALPSGEAK